MAYVIKDPNTRVPRFSWAEPGDGELILHIADAESGLCVKQEDSAQELQTAGVPDNEEGLGFEIAGADGVYVPADAAEIEMSPEGPIIRVSSGKVTEPVFARYLWTNYRRNISVLGQNGIPLAPFRTSRKDGFTVGA